LLRSVARGIVLYWSSGDFFDLMTTFVVLFLYLLSMGGPGDGGILSSYSRFGMPDLFEWTVSRLTFLTFLKLSILMFVG